MTFRIGNQWGCLLFIGVVFVPGLIASFALHEASWAFLLPIGIIAILQGIAALPISRRVTPEDYADELERHLSGRDDDDDWDRTSSVKLTNARLERLRRSLPDSFDELATDEDRLALQRIIEALRRGEIPDAN